MQKENKKDEKKWVILFMGFVIVNLFLYFILNSYFSIFILVVLLWFLFFYFFFRKVGNLSIKIIIIMLVIFLVSVGLFFIFSQNNNTIYQSNNSEQKQKINLKKRKGKDPYLEMRIAKHPQGVDCYQGNSVIEIMAKNVGGKDLQFEEVKNGKYEFSLCDGDKEEGEGFSCFPVPDYITVDDFGNITTGEEKRIIVNSASATGANSLTEFKKTKKNGKYKYFILFSKIESENKKPPISQSNKFEIFSNIMSDGNKYIKDCVS